MRPIHSQHFLLIASLSCLVHSPAFAKGKHAAVKSFDHPRLEDTIIAPGNPRVNPTIDPAAVGTKVSILMAPRILELGRVKDALPVTDEELAADVHVFDLARPEELGSFVAELDQLENLRELQLSQGKAASDPTVLDEDAVNGVREMRNLARLLRSEGLAPADRGAALAAIHELAFAFNSQFLRPLPRTTSVFSIFHRLAQHGGQIDLPVTNVAGPDADPENSTFWTKPAAIGTANLFVGAGATASYRLPAEPCTYAGAHTGYGIHPAFQARCGGQKLKIKFGTERSSGPFNSRIFAALGFNTTRIEYFPALELAYDRGLFKEFNESRMMGTSVSVTGADHWGAPITPGKNPFAYILSARLKDGTVIPEAGLAAFLLVNSQNLGKRIHGRDYSQLTSDANYNAANEARIQTLTMVEGSLTPKDASQSITVGAWDWDDETHASRRDIRGAMVVAAFLNDFDMRWDNNRVDLVATGKHGFELRERISDVGSGLGKAAKFFATSNGDANHFPAEFLKEDGKADFKFTRFNTNGDNETYAAVGRDDLRWIARYIAQLQPAQFRAALIAAGFSSAETLVIEQRLISRRNNLVQVAGLAGEIPLLPVTEPALTPASALVSTVDEDGKTVYAPAKGLYIQKDRVKGAVKK